MRLPTPRGSPQSNRKEDKSTLHEYVYKNDVDNATKCIASGDVDLNAVDDKGRTPVFIAASFSRCEILDALLTSGCDVNVTDVEFNTPLHEAVENGNTEIVRKLATHNGCNVDARNGQGQTALMKAAYYDYGEITKILLKDAGASPNIVDELGQSALLFALREGSHVTVDCLLKHGCDVTITDRLGQSALYIAVHSPCNKSLELAKRVFTSGYDVRNDRKWLLNEAKHNLFYQDDQFYCRLISSLKNTINDTCNNNTWERRTSEQILTTERKTSRISSFTKLGSSEEPIIEENEDFNTEIGTEKSETNVPTVSDGNKSKEIIKTRRWSKDLSTRARKNSKEMQFADVKSVTDLVEKVEQISVDTKTKEKSILKSINTDAHSQTTVRERLNSQELIARCAQSPPRHGAYRRQISIQCDVITKATMQKEPIALRMKRQTSLPAKPSVHFSTQILIYDSNKNC